MESKNAKKNTEIKNGNETGNEKPKNANNLDENDLNEVSGGIPTPIILVPIFGEEKDKEQGGN